MAPVNPENAARKERLEQAVAEARASKKPNYSALARKYNVKRESLTYHLREAPPTESLRNRMSQEQRAVMLKYVQQLDDANILVSGGLIEVTGNYLLQRDAGGRECKLLSKMWSYRYLERLTIEFKNQKKAHVNLKRLKAEHLDAFADYFRLLKSKIEEHNIGPSNIYNMSLGFQFHQRGLRRGVATDIEGSDTSAAARLKSGALTIIECVAANGFAVPPLFVVKGETHLEWWDDSPDVPEGARESTSPTGWVTPNLAMHWIRHFDAHTKSRVSRGQKRLLLVDGHESHFPPEFFDICATRKIVVLSFVPFSQELLQPLDGQPFLEYEEILHSDINNGEAPLTDKDEFLAQVMSARRVAFNEQTIRDMFANCGIWPLDPEKILQPLQKQLDEAPAPREVPNEPTPEPRAPSPPPRAIRIVRARAEEAVALQKKDAKQVMNQLRQIYNLNLKTCGMVLQLQDDLKKRMEFEEQRSQNRRTPTEVPPRRNIKTSRLVFSRVAKRKLAAQARRRKSLAKYGISGARKRPEVSEAMEID
ncbi:uncharacterized protein N7473_006390 [Penicillium subrubescens]|uniref:DDE-1 domain-containing protein n=1 Tax=Penicillium subrubescens TaxID=1316194 RepID=A0A1Q5URG1_9EURO|nr:uncharacterized protein N7473_006390 [Penicillium subrubescens]KAJ5896991.1 hypothetical protein N7473_006390 [Penicillium subrubescens]OKP15065.1 hypothetical protein PENSUB_3046 [Penicillium subrubescens]